MIETPEPLKPKGKEKKGKRLPEDPTDFLPDDLPENVDALKNLIDELRKKKDIGALVTSLSTLLTGASVYGFAYEVQNAVDPHVVASLEKALATGMGMIVGYMVLLTSGISTVAIHKRINDAIHKINDQRSKQDAGVEYSIPKDEVVEIAMARIQDDSEISNQPTSLRALLTNLEDNRERDSE